jgi:hypothetical protein
MKLRSQWIALVVVVIAAFAVLLDQKRELDHSQPPIPERVLAEDGRLLFTGDDIRRGQNTWQSLGGQEVGSIWGHGAYVAPDWTADWLHRESTFVLDHVGARRGTGLFRYRRTERRPGGAPGSALIRTSTFDPATDTLTLATRARRRPSRPTPSTTPMSSRDGATPTPSPKARSPTRQGSADVDLLLLDELGRLHQAPRRRRRPTRRTGRTSRSPANEPVPGSLDLEHGLRRLPPRGGGALVIYRPRR